MTTISNLKSVAFSSILTPNKLGGLVFQGEPRPTELPGWRTGPVPWAAVLVLAILVLDLNTSLGVTTGALYSIPVLIASLAAHRGAMLGVAMLSSLLIGVGWLLSPGSAPLELMLLNRTISLVVVWAPAIIVLRTMTLRLVSERRAWRECAGAAEVQESMRVGLTKLLTLAEQLGRSGESASRTAQWVRSRAQVMLSVLGMLSKAGGGGVEMRTILRSMLPGSSADLLRMEGPELIVPPRQVQPLAIVIHELLTNCRTHGALSTSAGRIEVRWSVEAMEGEPARRVKLSWQETGGREIEGQPLPRFGTSVISGTVVHDLSGTVELGYPTQGCSHQFQFILDGPPSGHAPQASGRAR